MPSFPSIISWKDHSFLIEWSWHLGKNHLTKYVRVYYWALYSILYIYISVFMTVQYCFDYCSFVSSFFFFLLNLLGLTLVTKIIQVSGEQHRMLSLLKSGNMHPPVLFIFQDCFSYSGSLEIFLKFFNLFIFRESGRKGERGGEKHWFVVASCVPPCWGPGPRPRHVP